MYTFPPVYAALIIEGRNWVGLPEQVLPAAKTPRRCKPREAVRAVRKGVYAFSSFSAVTDIATSTDDTHMYRVCNTFGRPHWTRQRGDGFVVELFFYSYCFYLRNRFVS
jgi:hypothetical protein